MPFSRYKRNARDYPYLTGLIIGGDYITNGEGTNYSSSSSSSSSIGYNESSSSSSSSLDCPNNIYSITTTIKSDLTFTIEKYIAVKINSGVGKDNYIELYTSGTGYSYDTGRIFWGDTTNVNPKTSNGFISIVVNGDTYYVKKYSGDNTTDCCSNLIGTSTGSGSFTSAGFALVFVNGVELRWIRLYTLNPWKGIISLK